MEEKETEVAPRDTTVYSKDNLANEIILRYNKQNPDNKVEPDMVENWLTGGYDQATEIYMGDYQVSFNYADGTPTYDIFSYKDKSEENREEFIETAIIWIRAIHELDVRPIVDAYLTLSTASIPGILHSPLHSGTLSITRSIRSPVFAVFLRIRISPSTTDSVSEVSKVCA